MHHPYNNPKSKVEQRIFRVRVPATSANLGSGFDVMGLALTLYNTFSVKASEQTTIEVQGFADGVPSDQSNLFYRAFARLYEKSGSAPPSVSIQMELAAPQGRGLGSSATAVVGGLLAANAMLGEPFSKDELLGEAIELEHGKHADNVAPALLGGLVVNALDGAKSMLIQIHWPPELRVVIFAPDFAMDTMSGRALMPDSYPKADVVFSTSRVALFLGAITQGRYDLLSTAMQDRLHQPYRAKLFPLLPKLIEAAEESGAHGACLSGGGSSVLALATERLDDVAFAMENTAMSAGVSGRIYILDADPHGAQVSIEEEVE